MTINGRGVPADDYFDVVNPATGEVFERAPKCSPAQLDDAMDAIRYPVLSRFGTGSSRRGTEGAGW